MREDLFFMHHLKMHNLTKHIYRYDSIGSVIGMATLNDLLMYNKTDTKYYTIILVDPPYRELACVDRI